MNKVYLDPINLDAQRITDNRQEVLILLRKKAFNTLYKAESVCTFLVHEQGFIILHSFMLKDGNPASVIMVQPSRKSQTTHVS